ncbi:unnamed protein product [Polarella glacialis]|uniref:Small ribosomal subunit protein mS35 mitochondrial conserved domain-containing protein n=1 Tax=Polarella glacialis TaxID=89957 RepID=A0A813KYV1_POLGL|nr:unnamed protein product [Polarella glacialis]
MRTKLRETLVSCDPLIPGQLSRSAKATPATPSHRRLAHVFHVASLRLTHDRPQEETDRRGFVSPLTDLQDSSNLPRSANHRRFSYPHTLSYKVYWGPPSVQDTPNEYEGSMVGCTVSVRLSDLPLTQRQKERLIDIVGQDRIDEETGVFALEADTFLERNQNAALLGDMMEQLLREAKLADDLIPSSEFDGADYGAPGTRPVE